MKRRHSVLSLVCLGVSQTVGGVVTVTATVSGAPNGTLVSFATDLGEITPRAVVSDSLALAHLTSTGAGTAHISATTRGSGGTVQSATTVTFTAGNGAPFFTSTPVTTAAQGQPYTYAVIADDPDLADGDTLTITAPTLPTWLTLTDRDGGTATLAGTPANADVGNHPIVLGVSDSGGLTNTQTFTLTVWYRAYLPLVWRNTP
jgi:hypothetical protein